MNKKPVKLLLDFIPLILFFAAYKLAPSVAPSFKPAVFASMILTIAVAASMVLSFSLRIKLDKIAIISNILAIIFGSVTVFADNPTFIKVKLTVFYAIVSVVCIYFCITKKTLLRHVFGGKVEMTSECWITLTWRFAIFFGCLAILNEVIWRNASEAAWVNFKVFGTLPLTIGFLCFQIPFIKRRGSVVYDSKMGSKEGD